MTGLPLNIDPQQILLHLFNFTILFGALYILLYKPVRDFMAKRTSYYADMDSKAEDALHEAEESKAAYEAKVQSFDEEVRAERAKMNKEVAEQRERKSQRWSQTLWRSSRSSSRLPMLSTSSLTRQKQTEGEKSVPQFLRSLCLTYFSN